MILKNGRSLRKSQGKNIEYFVAVQKKDSGSYFDCVRFYCVSVLYLKTYSLYSYKYSLLLNYLPCFYLTTVYGTHWYAFWYYNYIKWMCRRQTCV
jgi:hypothetical protein